MSDNKVDLKTLKSEFEKRKKELEEAEKKYTRMKYRSDVKVITDMMLEKCIDSVAEFGELTLSDKKKIAEKFALTFPDFMRSDDVQSMLAESKEKRDRLKKNREEKKAVKLQEQAYDYETDADDDYEMTREATFDKSDPYANSGQSYN